MNTEPGAVATGSNTRGSTPALVVALARYTNTFNTQGETQIIMTTAE